MLISVLQLACSVGGASAAQRPVERLRATPPFGPSFRAVCGPAIAGDARCLADVVTVRNGSTAAPLVSAAPAGYGPADLQAAYEVGAAAAAAGGAQTVGIVDAYDDPTAESDLATYRAEYGLSPCTPVNGCFRKVDQRGGTSYPPPDSDWAGEIALDTDMVSAICPNCHILLVEADSATFADLGAAVNEAASLGATQISNSYGGNEGSFETNFDLDYDHPGIAVTASSGDWGYGVYYPAASPYVSAVGGTSLSAAPGTMRGWAETAWSSAGSGCSQYESKPSWQLDTGCSERTVADVSAVADPYTGVAAYSTDWGGWVVFGGTSVASPIVAAFDALIGPAAASPQYPYANSEMYFDVTSGSNGSCGTYLCQSGPGYDGPTGVGTPDGAHVDDPPCSASPTVTTDPVSETVTAPDRAVFTAAADNADPSCQPPTVQWQVSTDGGKTFRNVTGATSETLDISSTSAQQSGNEYMAVFSNELGLTDTTPATLIVNTTCSAASTVTADPISQTVTAPSGAAFTVAAENGDPSCQSLVVQWEVSIDGGATFMDIAGATSDTLDISPTSAAQSGDEYMAVFTNEFGSTDTAPATLTVNPTCSSDPTVDLDPVSQTVTAPASAEFTASAYNADPICQSLAVQWEVSTDGGVTFTDVAGATSDTLFVSPTSTQLSGDEYMAVFTNEVGSTDTTPATLTVSPPCSAPPTVTADPVSQIVIAPRSVEFTSSADNADPNCQSLAVQWQVSTDGGETFTDVAGATSDTLIISATSTRQSGDRYMAVFANEFGSTDTTAATLTVSRPCSALPTVISNPVDETAAFPSSAVFIAAASNLDPSCHTLAVQWQVSRDGGETFTNIAGATSATLLISATAADQSGNEYMAVFTNEVGSTDTNPATLTVNSAPTSVVPPAISGAPIVGDTLTAFAGAWFSPQPMWFSYLWQRCTPLCVTIANATNSSYTLTNADLGATILVQVTAVSAGGASRALGWAAGPVAAGGPGTASIRAELTHVLAPLEKRVRIGVLLKHGGYPTSFTAPAAGRLAIFWYTPRRGPSRTSVLVADTTATLRGAGATRLRVALTTSGRRLLASVQHLTLTAEAVFTTTGLGAMTAARTLTVSR